MGIVLGVWWVFFIWFFFNVGLRFYGFVCVLRWGGYEGVG